MRAIEWTVNENECRTEYDGIKEKKWGKISIYVCVYMHAYACVCVQMKEKEAFKFTRLWCHDETNTVDFIYLAW